MTSREYWYAQAVDDAQLYGCLLNLIPWEDRNLSHLPSHIHPLLLRKLDELVANACRDEIALGTRTHHTAHRLHAAVWNFLKPWRRNEAPVYIIPRPGETQHV